MTKRNRDSDSADESERSYYRRKYKETKRELKEVRRSERRRLEEKEERLNDETMQVFVRRIRQVYTPVLNGNGDTLWLQPDHKIQEFYRDLLDEFACRWSQNEHLPDLELESVKVRDNKPILPKGLKDPGAGPINYAKIFLDLVLAGFGDPKGNKVLQDFVDKLSKPELTIFEFQNLYFHHLLQSLSEIAAFPFDAISKLRDLGIVKYDNKIQCWEDAYADWFNKKYPQGRNINLAQTCQNNPYAYAVYKHRAKEKKNPYNNTIIDEADLVRNLIVIAGKLQR